MFWLQAVCIEILVLGGSGSICLKTLLNGEKGSAYVGIGSVDGAEMATLANGLMEATLQLRIPSRCVVFFRVDTVHEKIACTCMVLKKIMRLEEMVLTVVRLARTKLAST